MFLTSHLTNVQLTQSRGRLPIATVKHSPSIELFFPPTLISVFASQSALLGFYFFISFISPGTSHLMVEDIPIQSERESTCHFAVTWIRTHNLMKIFSSSASSKHLSSMNIISLTNGSSFVLVKPSKTWYGLTYWQLTEVDI